MTRDDLFNVGLNGLTEAANANMALEFVLSAADQCWYCQDTPHSSGRALPRGKI